MKCNWKIIKKSIKNSKVEKNEEVQYESGIDIDETLSSIKLKITKQRIKDGEKTEKEFLFKCLIKTVSKDTNRKIHSKFILIKIINKSLLCNYT